MAPLMSIRDDPSPSCRFETIHFMSIRHDSSRIVKYPNETIIVSYYMTKASGRYSARSDWLRARSEQRHYSAVMPCSDPGPITDYAN